MGEASGCLVRSLSQPSPTNEFKEGDPLRALTTSVSFGRFMKEPLDWEKWSSFTHNRNLEEVEKYSKPGSVAAKKAYFEAHYRKIAAKKAAAIVEQENEAPNLSPEPNSTSEIPNSEMCSDLPNKQQNVAHPYTAEQSCTNSMTSNLAKSNSLEVHRASIVSSVYGNGNEANDEGNGHSTAGTEVSQDAPEKVILSESPIQVIMNVEATVPEEIFLSDSPTQVIMNVEADEFSSTRTEQAPEEVLSESPIQVNLLNQLENAEKHRALTAIQEEKTPLKGDKVLSTKKRPVIHSLATTGAPKVQAPVKSSIPVHYKKEDVASNIKKAVRDLTERKRLTPQSLHMSINFGSTARVSTKRSSPVLHKIGNPKLAKTSVKPPIERPTRQAPTRASVNGVVSNHSLVLLQQNNKRSNTPLDRSICDSRTIVGKSQSLSVGHSDSTIKPRPSTVSSSFVLRSEERAAKRKEFFQKLEEKVNAKATVNIQRQAKSKIPLTRPQSPKPGRKPSPSTVQYSFSRPPWGTYSKTDHSKNFIEKNKQNLTRSVTSLPKKKMGENSSPNIQL